MLSIREYYYDWRPLEPAMLLLERLDKPVDTGDVAAALDAAGEQLTRSLTYWAEYMVTARARGTDNAFIAPRREPRGLQTMHYAFCFWQLRPDEALVVRFAVPQARYWSVQLYQHGWFEALDMARPTSLNHRQLRIGDDGEVTVVLAASDPGYANWLDTEGREEGLLTFRCAWLAATAPQAATEVVPLQEVDRAVGGVTPRMDPTERAEQIAARRTHLRWRFRT